MYLLSNGFESPASAQIGLIVINLICGFMLNLVHLVCVALESVKVRQSCNREWWHHFWNHS